MKLIYHDCECISEHNDWPNQIDSAKAVLDESMLVTFHSKAWSSVTMFGEVAAKLLKMMGHSGTVPSALLAADVPSALERLKQALAVAGPEEERLRDAQANDKEADSASRITLGQRAYPLMQLLSAAADKGCDVMWIEGNRVV